MRKSRQHAPARNALIAFAVTICAVCTAVSQTRSTTSGQTSSGQTSSGMNTSIPPRANSPVNVWNPDSDLVLDPNYSHRQRMARRDDVRRRLMENTAKLLELTQQLHAGLTDRPATPEDARRLDEIAKLARSVRDGMRQ